MRNRKQKGFCVLLLLVLVLISVCGCGGTDVDSESVLPQDSDAVVAEGDVLSADDGKLMSEEPAEPEKQCKTEDAGAVEMKKSAQPENKQQNKVVPTEQTVPAQPKSTVKTELEKEATCTISISCATVLNNLDLCDAAKADLVPQDGWILKPTKVTLQDGDSVFDVLLRTCKTQKIPLEFADTPVNDSAYIEGIYNLCEFDAGDLSGWMYNVNDTFPNYGCSQYEVQDGDNINWLYTCDMGDDIGGKNTL